MSRDYIAAFKASAKDLKHAGVKGMRWGVRRDRSTLRAAAKTRAAAPAKKDSTDEKAPASSGAPAKKPSGNIQDNVESSSARYDRIAGQAASGRAADLTDQDLKFFNARTEALAKVAKLNEEQPSWLRDTASKVIQQSAQRQMQSLTDAVADKYIGDPLKNALKGASAGAATASTKAAAPAAKAAVETTKKAVSTSTKSSVPGMSREQALQFFRDNPARNKPLPENYSASGNFDLFKKLREQGLVD